MKHPPLDALLRQAVKQPYYLGSTEHLMVRADIESLSDAWGLTGAITDRESGSVIRYGVVPITAAQLRDSQMRGDRQLVDLVLEKLEELYELLEPPMPADDLFDLMMQAFGSDEACDVLVDAGLEREAIRPPKRTIGRRADTRTDAEKATDERVDLHKKAKAWARPFVEILFRRNWSTRPWAPNPLRLAGYGLTSGIAMRFADRVRQIADLRNAAIIDDDQAVRLMNSLNE